jgi:hypothetical protein
MSENNKNAQDKIFDLILSEALKEDCEREVSLFKDGEEHIFSDKFEKNIKSIENQLKRKKNNTKFKKTAPKLTAAAAAVIVCVSLATNPSVSAFFKSIIVKITEGFNQHEFIDDIEITMDNFNYEIRPDYLPEGYRISRIFYSFVSMFIEYIDEDDNSIVLQYGPANSGEIAVDNENSELYTVSVNEKEAIFYKTNAEDRPSYLVWNSGGYAFIISAQIEKEEFVKIAENIKIS